MATTITTLASIGQENDQAVPQTTRTGRRRTRAGTDRAKNAAARDFLSNISLTGQLDDEEDVDDGICICKYTYLAYAYM